MKVSGPSYPSILVGPLGVQEGLYIKCTQGTFPQSLAPSMEILAEEMEVGSRECMRILEKCLRSVEVEAVSTWLGLISIHAKNSCPCSRAVVVLTPPRHSVSAHLQSSDCCLPVCV